MTIYSLAVVFALGTAAPSSFTLPERLDGQTILFVGAHPDDEWGVAPILAEACIDKGARCHFVVAAGANSLGCLLTIRLKDAKECSRRRRLEMQASAALFRGSVTFLDLDDLFYAYNQAGVDRTVMEWSRASGGRDALIARFRGIVEADRPAMIFTLDPRHGSTCHAGHRAVARLLIDAVAQLPASERPPIWLEQTDQIEERANPANTKIMASFGYLGWPDTAASTVWFGDRRLSNGANAFDYGKRVRQAHATQFPDEAQDSAEIPTEARSVPLALLTDRGGGDYCSPLGLKRPTLDTPEGRAFLARMLKAD